MSFVYNKKYLNYSLAFYSRDTELKEVFTTFERYDKFGAFEK